MTSRGQFGKRRQQHLLKDPHYVSVTVKCVGCGAKREIQVGEHPMCTCGMPMIATVALSRLK